MFKYDKKLNAFVQVYDGTAIRGVIAVANRIMTTTYDNSTGVWEEVICYYRFEDNKTVVRENPLQEALLIMMDICILD